MNVVPVAKGEAVIAVKLAPGILLMPNKRRALAATSATCLWRETRDRPSGDFVRWNAAVQVVTRYPRASTPSRDGPEGAITPAHGVTSNASIRIQRSVERRFLSFITWIVNV